MLPTLLAKGGPMGLNVFALAKPLKTEWFSLPNAVTL